MKMSTMETEPDKRITSASNTTTEDYGTHVSGTRESSTTSDIFVTNASMEAEPEKGISGTKGMSTEPNNEGNMTGPTDNRAVDPSVKKQLPRSARKRARFEELKQLKKQHRKEAKMRRKVERANMDKISSKTDTDHVVSKRETNEMIKTRCLEALKTGQRICIDMDMEAHLRSGKEMSKLAGQIGRLYGSNRRLEEPAHLYLCGLSTGSDLYKECIRMNSGFENYILDRTEKSYQELFSPEELVYLSPDSDTVLTEVDHSKVYVLGGLVDEHVAKNTTLSKASSTGISTARLPIQEHMIKVQQQSHSTVLGINQVFDILMTYKSSRSWPKALAVGVPKRKGFVCTEMLKTAADHT